MEIAPTVDGTDPRVSHAVEELHRSGFTVIDGVLDSAKRDEAHHALTELSSNTPTGRDDFEGARTRRVYSLFAKSRAFDEMATHDLVLAIVHAAIGPALLSSPAGIVIGPGETAQDLHRDDAIYPIPRPHDEVVINAMWALDDFTPENGATRLVPASHLDPSNARPSEDRALSVTMSSGSVLLYVGSLWHGGGANTTHRSRAGVAMHYAAGWLRPGENHMLSLPPNLAADVPVRLQELLGYSIHPPFLGNVDGRHPRKLLVGSGETP